jgi:hypothetical protein
MKVVKCNSKGGHQARVHSDQMVLKNGQSGRLNWVTGGQRHTKLQGNYQAQVYSYQMVIMEVNGRLD